MIEAMGWIGVALFAGEAVCLLGGLAVVALGGWQRPRLRRPKGKRRA